MKILFLSDDFPPKNFGGAGIVTHGLAKGLVHAGHEVFVITTVQDKKASRGWKTLDGMRVYDLYNDYDGRLASYVSLYNLGTVGVIKKIIEEVKPDVIHAHNIHNNISYHALAVARRYTEKVFLTAFDAMSFNYGKLVNFYNKDDLSIQTKFSYKVGFWQNLKTAKKRYNPLRNFFIRWYLNKYTKKIFPVSHALAESLHQNGIKNLETIHNGIDTKSFVEDPAKTDEFKNKYKLAGKKVALVAGRISWAKGGDAALDAIIKVSKSVANVCLLIIGSEDVYMAHLIKKAKLAGVMDNVRFISWLDRREITSAYYASDIVLAPSLYLDPFPTVNLEAMSAKKPIVGTCFGGTPEIVVDKETGLIVNPNNVDMFAHAIQALLNDVEYAKKLGQSGYERVVKYFSTDEFVADTVKWYQG
jgi:glycosyltransferase involved in cell wall biosynthesis